MKTKEKLTPPLKFHGGKNYLAKDIIDLMPPRCQNPNDPAPGDTSWLHYVEPYFGGGAVLLANNPEGISEVVNDIDGALTNFWRILQHRDLSSWFIRRAEATPFSEGEYGRAVEVLAGKTREPVLRAWAYFVVCRQSLAGRMRGFATLTRNRTRRGMNEQASAWIGAVDGLAAVHERLRRVVILDAAQAADVIKKQDGPRTLFYLDPPYLETTRSTPSVYAYEMTEQQHGELLDLLSDIEGRFLLSGYPSDLYDAYERQMGWRRVDIAVPNQAAGGKTKRIMTECVWMNYG
jgi:DNA adenine methylase